MANFAIMRIIENILNVKFPGKKLLTIGDVQRVVEEFDERGGSYITEELINTPDKRVSAKKQLLRNFVEYLFYRNVANYDSMLLISAMKGTGKSSAAIMIAKEWCKLIGIKFDPDRHISYSNAQVIDKLSRLRKFEPLICLTGDSKVLIRSIEDGKIKNIEIKDLVGRTDFEVRSYDIKKDEFEWVKPDACILNGENKEVFEIELENGKKIKATEDHKFLTKNGKYKKLKDLTEDDELVIDTIKCKVCGKEFIRKTVFDKYCSFKCSEKQRCSRVLAKHHKTKVLIVRKKIKCKICGKSFIPKTYNNTWCRKCWKIKKTRTVYKTIKCQICGKDFIPKTYCNTLCSKKCRILKKKEHLENAKKKKKVYIKNCKICGKTFESYYYITLCCSETCKTKNMSMTAKFSHDKFKKENPLICKERSSLAREKLKKELKNDPSKKEYIKLRYSKWSKKYYAENPEKYSYKVLRISLCTRVKRSLLKKGLKKNDSVVKYIGCSIIELREHLEKQFKKNMTWKNYGEWHVDHIKPIALFDLNKKDELLECFHYTNLQPLWAMENFKKGARY